MKRIFLICLALIASLIVFSSWGYPGNNSISDGYSSIQIKESNVQSIPKGSTILAYIDGHSLTVTFTENLGTVQVDVTTALGDRVEYTPIWTPDSFTTYLASTGSYVVTITLPNGDEYYGEFEVTD